MIPIFNLFGKSISAYMIFAIVGYLVTLFVMVKIAVKHKLDEFHMLYMLLFAAIGVLIGGHILYGITNIDLIIKLFQNIDKITSIKNFFDHIFVIFGGSVFYGGMIGAVVIAYIYIRKNKLNSLEYMSAAVMGIPLFHFFGRLGCFFSGCCYGIEWSKGITYHYSAIEAANEVARFPVQLIEATVNIVLFLVMLYVYTKTKYKLKTMYIYFLLYPSCRFVLEYFRGDEYRGFFLGLSTSQIISIILIVITIFVCIVERYKKICGCGM